MTALKSSPTSLALVALLAFAVPATAAQDRSSIEPLDALGLLTGLAWGSDRDATAAAFATIGMSPRDSLAHRLRFQGAVGLDDALEGQSAWATAWFDDGGLAEVEVWIYTSDSEAALRAFDALVARLSALHSGPWFHDRLSLGPCAGQSVAVALMHDRASVIAGWRGGDGSAVTAEVVREQTLEITYMSPEAVPDD